MHHSRGAPGGGGGMLGRAAAHRPPVAPRPPLPLYEDDGYGFDDASYEYDSYENNGSYGSSG